MSTRIHGNGVGRLTALLAVLAGGTVETLAQNAFPGTTVVPAAWYQSDQGVLMTGTSVTNWTDLSGNGNDAAPDTTTVRPAFVDTAMPYGKPVLRFDGSNDRLMLRTPLLSQDWTLFAVAKPAASSGSYGIVGCLKYGMVWQVLKTSGKQNMSRRDAVSLATGSSAIPTDAYSLLSIRHANGANDTITMRRDRQDDGTASVGGANTFASNTVAVGYTGYYGSFLGDMAAVVIFTNALADADVATVEDHLHRTFFENPVRMETVLVIR